MELRQKLDDKIGGGGGVGGGGTKGKGGSKKSTTKSDYSFKFPYDTLRKRRSGKEVIGK